MELAVVGLALLLASVVLYLVSQSNKLLARSAIVSHVSSIGEVITLHEKVATQIGSDLFAQPVGIQGVLECDDPLVSSLGSTPCAAFRYRVTRRWEEEYVERDDAGKLCRRIRTGSDLVAGNERRVPFWVRDASGRLLVDPNGARLELEKIIDRFDPGESGDLVRLGSFQLDLTGFRARPQRLTLGYHFQEEVLPLDRQVYVLGLAVDHAGSLRIVGSPEEKAPFLVSLKTHDQLVASAKQTMTRALYGAYICAPLGLVLVLIGLLYRR